MKCTIKRRSRYVRVCRPTHLKSVARERKKERKERVESDGGVGGGRKGGGRMRSITPKEERDESSYGAWPLILVPKVNGTRPFFFRSVTIPYELSLHNS